ncbi:hypothetical protein [Sinomicrobium sp.]
MKRIYRIALVAIICVMCSSCAAIFAPGGMYKKSKNTSEIKTSTPVENEIFATENTFKTSR